MKALEEMEQVVSNENGRTEENNPQVIFAKYKREIITHIRDISKTTVPKLDGHIKKSKDQMDQILNDSTIQLEEKQALAAIIEEKIRDLEMRRHTKVRDNLAAKNAIESETLSKYWIQINKEKKPRDTIEKLQASNVTRPAPRPGYEVRSDKMANMARDYHNDLQSAGLDSIIENQETQDVLANLEPRLSSAEKQGLSHYIKYHEVQQTIKDLPNGKAAGIDGIPHEFWKTLADRHVNRTKANIPSFDIVKCLTTVYNDIEKYGVSPTTNFAKGWMCPIYKKGDTAEICNYRPITVLNTDYKIMTRILTTRLSVVAPKLVHCDQAGFMKGRRIEDQTELAKLMLNKCEVDEENGVIVCLDQEKAYDKIRHEFIWESLEKYQLPEHFIKTVRTLYTGAETVVIINGVISSPYRVTRGVRQGDPLSCLIFNLAIESLASLLRGSQLQGFKTEGYTDRLITTLFADDTTVYLSQQDDFADLQEILNKWCHVSGAKFNVQKTIIIPVGTPEYRRNVCQSRQINEGHQQVPNNIQIAKDGTPVRVLGAFIGNGLNEVSIWTSTLEKIDSHLKQWNRNHPTQDGRRHIINMEVAARTQYLTRVQGMLNRLWLKKFNTLCGMTKARS